MHSLWRQLSTTVWQQGVMETLSGGLQSQNCSCGNTKTSLSFLTLVYSHIHGGHFPERLLHKMMSSHGHPLIGSNHQAFLFYFNTVNIGSCIPQKEKFLGVLSNFQECREVPRPNRLRTTASRRSIFNC